MANTYKYNDTTQLTDHFNVQEFRCKCGGTHNITLNPELPKKLEQLRTALNCSSVVINSGHRCASHDKAVGGSGTGQHVYGNAADIVCYDKSGNKISSKKVSCAAQDIGFGGIANIDSTYTATHVDVRTSNFWKGDEVKTTATSVTSDFYSYYGIDRSKCINETDDDFENSPEKRLQKALNALGENLDIDGFIGTTTLATLKKHPVNKGDTGDYVKAIQEILNSKGYSCGTADGIAGDKTLSALCSAAWDRLFA